MPPTARALYLHSDSAQLTPHLSSGSVLAYSSCCG
uniref:Uncharacterized protein n=1 Tax=Arundo donax TaxID=35708 RepID=A0A0A9DTU2_ARUDO